MVGTIAPLVQVAKRQWLVSTSAFAVASVAGGLLFGASLGILGTVATALIGAAMPQFILMLLGLCGVVFALVDLGVLPVTVPTLHRSVPQRWWLRYGPTRGAVAYGAVLGMGVTTFIPFASFYMLLVGALLLGPVAGGLIGAAYGLGRALPVPFASLAMVCGVEPVGIGRSFVRSAARRSAQRLCAVALLVCISTALLSSLHWP